MVIAQRTGFQTFKYIASVSKNDFETWISLPNLLPGQYIIFIACDWYLKTSQPFTLCSYGVDDVQFFLMAKKEHLLEEVFKDRARRVPNKQKKYFHKKDENEVYKVINF